MTIQEKAAAFLADYNRDLKTITDRITETDNRLNDLFLEIRFIENKELPEAIESRVLAGDSSQEKKLRKILDKLEAERTEKTEDLAVLNAALANFKQKKANEIRNLHKLFQEEKNLISQKAQKKILVARSAYIEAMQKESAQLHDLRILEAEIQAVEVNAGRREYVSANFPLDWPQFAAMSIDRNEIAKIIKLIK